MDATGTTVKYELTLTQTDRHLQKSYVEGPVQNNEKTKIENVVWIITTGDFTNGAKRRTVLTVHFPHTINSKTGTSILYQPFIKCTGRGVHSSKIPQLDRKGVQF